MDSHETIKLAAYQELQEALKIKRINDELLEYLTSSLRWLLHYSQKYHMTLPEKDAINEMLGRTISISDKLPSDSILRQNQHGFKHGEDSTEQNKVKRSHLLSRAHEVLVYA